MKKLFALAGLALLLFAVSPGQAGVASGVGSDAFAPRADDEPKEVDAAHHVADGFELDFTPFGKVPLPRLFIVRGESGSLGFDFFWSTHAALESGRYVADTDHASEAGGDAAAAGDADDLHTAANPGGVGQDGQVVGHDGQDADAHDADADQDAAAHAPAGDEGGHGEEATLAAASGHIVLDLSITRHLVFVWLVAGLCLFLFIRLARRYVAGVGRETAPQGRMHNALETLILYVRDEIARPNIGARADRYVPFLLTLWFFILFANLVGLVPLSVTSTANITITGVLAIFTFVVVQASGNRHYWTHIFWPPGIPAFVKPILVPIEFLGIFIKPFVLAVRLFANMTAGHMVILSLIGLIFTIRNTYGAGAAIGVAPVSVLFALFIYGIELLVSFLQAYIFVMLSALYIGQAVEEHEHHENAHGHGASHDGLSPALGTSESSGNGLAVGAARVAEPALAG